MKTLKLFVMAAVLLMVASCVTGKKTATNQNATNEGPMIQLDPCQEYAMACSKIRSWGKGSNFQESTASSMATANARAEFARKIESAVIAGTEQVSADLKQYAGGDSDGMSVSDQSVAFGEVAKTIAQQVVKNTNVVKYTKYYNSANKQYTVYVCLEYGGGESGLVDQIESKVEERISPENRKKIEDRHDKIRERILSSLNKQQ